MKALLKNKIFLSFVLSYLLVLMIPYGIGYFVYNNSVKILSEKIYQIEKAALNDRVEMIEYKVSGFMTTLKQVATNDELGVFIDYYDPYRNGDAYFAMSQLRQQLESAILNNPTVKNITVYSRKNDRMITSSSGSVYDNYEKFPFKEVWGISSSDYSQLLQQSGLKYRFFTNLSSGEKNIFITMPIIISDMAKPEGLIIAEMAGINNLINNEKMNNDISAFMIVNEEKQTISNETEFLHDVEIDVDKVKGLTSSFSENIENGKYLLTYQPSSVNSWTYISMVDMEVYLKDVDDFNRTVLVYVFISSLLGVFIAIVISQQKYKPIRRLKNLSSSFKAQNYTNSDNDYEFIESSIDNMIHTVDNYKIHMLKQERKNMSWYFSRIIRGWNVEMDSDFDSAELQEIKDRISISKNCVLIYQIDDFMEKFYASGLLIEEESTVELVSFILTNVLEEYFSEYGAQHVLSLDNDNRFVIPIVLQDQENVDYIEKANFIKQFLNQKFGIIGSMAISGIHIGKNGIKEGYDEAIDVIEFKGIIGDQNIVATYDNLLSEKGNRNLMFRIEKEKIFVNFILVEDFNEAKKTIYNIIDEDVAEVRSLQTLKVKLFGMIDKMMYGLMSLSERSEYFNLINQDQIDRLLNASSIPELKSIIDIIFNQLVLIRLNTQNEQEDNQKTQEILDYVQKNIKNPDLNVSMIAEEFDMTISNLSKYFKKEFGQCALDYIHLLRVNEAKTLLLNSENTLSDIANMIGYYNYRTLVSRFKKYEGVTPTQYREKVQ